MAEGLVISQSSGVTLATIKTSSLTDGSAIESLGKDLRALVDERALTKVIVDFHHVTFLSSSMIGMLVDLDKRSKAIEGKVVLAGLKPNLMQVFKITRLDKVLTFAKSEQDAMSLFKW